jgi:hypothetical protein
LLWGTQGGSAGRARSRQGESKAKRCMKQGEFGRLWGAMGCISFSGPPCSLGCCAALGGHWGGYPPPPLWRADEHHSCSGSQGVRSAINRHHLGNRQAHAPRRRTCNPVVAGRWAARRAHRRCPPQVCLWLFADRPPRPAGLPHALRRLQAIGVPWLIPPARRSRRVRPHPQRAPARGHSLTGCVFFIKPAHAELLGNHARRFAYWLAGSSRSVPSAHVAACRCHCAVRLGLCLSRRSPLPPPPPPPRGCGGVGRPGGGPE